MGERFLILSARMGAGHDAVAAELGLRLARRGHQVEQADILDLLPPGFGVALHTGYRTAIRHLAWSYGAVYAAFFRTGPGRRPGSAPLAALAADRLLALVAEHRPDAVVPVFHLAAQLTGRLREQHRLQVPSAVVVTDFAVHRQWLHRGNDWYLCVCPQAAADVRRVLGRPVAAPGPVVPAEFRSPAPGASRWHRLLKEAGHGREAVLLSAGAWGAGSGLAATAELLNRAGYLPVALCGRNDRLRQGLARLPGVLALGWVEDLSGLMGACRVLIDNAAGQTAMQALSAGLPVLCYRPLPGHGSDGVLRMVDLGVAAHPGGPRELVASLDALSGAGPVRQRRIAAGQALFTADTADFLSAPPAGRAPNGGASPPPR